MKPKVFYCIGTKIGGQGLSLVAEIACEALEKNGMLEQVVCYGKQKTSKVSRINQIFFQPAKLFSYLPSKYYYSMKRYWIDFRSSYYLKKSHANIFHGWTHESLNSIKIAKSKGMLTILERGNPHPLYSKKTLENECILYDTHNFFLVNDKSLLLRKFNHYRYEAEEAIEEIELSDYIFVNSDFCASTYIDFGIPANKIIILPRGFDPKNYFPRPLQKKDDKFILLFVGEIILRKGIKYILEAWREISAKNSELWFVGHVSDEASGLINEYSGLFNNIKYFGKQSNPSPFFQKASVFIFPSLDEGSAKVTYEAMASGLPCIFTQNSGSLADDKTAIIVPIRSSRHIAKAVIKLRNDVDYRNIMGKKASLLIRKYTWQHYKDSLIKTYSELLALKH
jgi:glycosyltransferase involved in cell wall biosynthesis